MKQKNNFDEFDNLLFNFYNKNNNVPSSTTETIKNALLLDNIKKTKSLSNKLLVLKKVAIFVISFTLVAVTTVFSKDIIYFFNKIFNNSNKGIDTAVENGYVQNIDMDFVVDNDLGVKSDYILMDDHSLDISFIYKYYNEDIDVKQIEFPYLSIKDENNNIIYISTNNIIDQRISHSSLEKLTNQQKLNSNTLRDSLLITSNSFPNSKFLTIEFTGFDIIEKNDNIIHIDGNWTYTINLENKFIYRNTQNYIVSENEYVKNVSTILTDTTLIIELHLNTEINTDLVLDENGITLNDSNSNYYITTKTYAGNNINTSKNYKSIVKLYYPITTYDNLDILFLQIKLDIDKILNLELIKK